jgi:hypothetical protein
MTRARLAIPYVPHKRLAANSTVSLREEISARMRLSVDIMSPAMEDDGVAPEVEVGGGTVIL